MTFHSALYVGSVMHRRLRPRVHRLRYRVFWILLDLDEIDRLQRNFRLFAYNRFNVLSFYDTDHGDGRNISLREQVDGHLRAAGIDIQGGSIRLLCMPRIFGYGFNPLSIYFCHRADGSVAATLYEVHNTFGERHSYLIPIEAGAGPIIVQHCQKHFYVSPFMDMDLNYAFRVTVPGERASLAIDVSDKDGRVLTAALAGKRVTLSDTALLRLLATHPALTLKVVAAIHWHALRMLFKGFKLRPRPSPPDRPVTVANIKGTPL
jgi:uncharacterized protein